MDSKSAERGRGRERVVEKMRRRNRKIGCISGCLRPVSGRHSEFSVHDSARRDYRPTHLVVMVNGLIGSASNWKFAAIQFVKKYPEDLIVHCSESNTSSLTFDGVDVMGERLAKEVLSVVAQKPELQKISFVSHSLGGLVTRYAIGRLYSQFSLKDSSESGDCKIRNFGAQCLDHGVRGKIAGLDPINFITVATPHLGSRSHNQIPILCGSRALEKMAYSISLIAGRTGNHLFLKDHHDGKPPLLLRMVKDCEDLQFMSALQSFKRRVVYSNVSFDFIVGRKTSSIRRQHELPKHQDFTRNGRYPHIVYVEKPKTSDMGHEEFFETKVSQPKRTSEMEEAMIIGLNSVTWERVDVSFGKTKQGILAHSTIQVKNFSNYSDGADVISHMVDNFLL